jgi:hypothetical protein
LVTKVIVLTRFPVRDSSVDVTKDVIVVFENVGGDSLSEFSGVKEDSSPVLKLDKVSLDIFALREVSR